jgi:hypothetical protein
VSIVRRNNMKKIWKKPELVVLVRSRPEESVLGFCKTGGAFGYADNVQVGCKNVSDGSICPKCLNSEST